MDAAIRAAMDRAGRIVAVALTHADPDHAAGAESVAVQLRVSVHAAPGRSRDLPFNVAAVADSDVVPGSDVPLRVVETPGPTPDHVAFVVGEGRLALVGDLDRVRGSRSILGATDQAAWSRSEARLRSVAPGAAWLGGHPTPPAAA